MHSFLGIFGLTWNPTCEIKSLFADIWILGIMIMFTIMMPFPSSSDEWELEGVNVTTSIAGVNEMHVLVEHQHGGARHSGALVGGAAPGQREGWAIRSRMAGGE